MTILGDIARALHGIEAPWRLIVPWECPWCERPVKISQRLMAHKDVPEWLDDLAAERCPCLSDVFWDHELGQPITHKSTRRSRIRQALGDLDDFLRLVPETREVLAARRAALIEALKEHQPERKTT